MRHTSFYTLKVEENGFSTLYCYPRKMQGELTAAFGCLRGEYHIIMSYERINGIKQDIDRAVMVDFADFKHIPRIMRYFWDKCEAIVMDGRNLVILIPNDPEYHIVARRSLKIRQIGA